MNPVLSHTGYEQTKQKLHRLEERLRRLETRSDLDAKHAEAVRNSYRQMIQQYAREIKIYEARQGETLAGNAPPSNHARDDC